MLRALVGFTLIAQGFGYLYDWSNLGALTLAAGGLAVAIGFCLLSGFLTPVAGVLVVVGGIGITVSSFADPGSLPLDGNLLIVNVIVISIAIFLLGPGAFSLDARMFGRREISIPVSAGSTKRNRMQSEEERSRGTW